MLMCDKSNAMTHAGGLWQRVFKEVAASIRRSLRSTCTWTRSALQMVRDPRQFDVIVTNNMFGDIITDLAAGASGRAGHGRQRQIHPGKTSMFEPVHGSAPPHAGQEHRQSHGRDPHVRR